ncbi:hypothetical protein AVEN_61923-1, partial [Araneus ventricosus]
SDITEYPSVDTVMGINRNIIFCRALQDLRIVRGTFRQAEIESRRASTTNT